MQGLAPAGARVVAAEYATVLGGEANEAAGLYSVVLGGGWNTATGGTSIVP